MKYEQHAPAIVLASCTKSAIAIATNVLNLSEHREADIVMHVPLFPKPDAYAGFEQLIETTIHATTALLRSVPAADLAVSLIRERIMRRRSARHGRVFSVGFVVSCYRHGPLFLNRAGDWLPDEEFAIFDHHAQRILEDLQGQISEPPTDPVVDVAKLITESLMRVPLSVEREVYSVQ